MPHEALSSVTSKYAVTFDSYLAAARIIIMRPLLARFHAKARTWSAPDAETGGQGMAAIQRRCPLTPPPRSTRGSQSAKRAANRVQLSPDARGHQVRSALLAGFPGKHIPPYRRHLAAAWPEAYTVCQRTLYSRRPSASISKHVD